MTTALAGKNWAKAELVSILVITRTARNLSFMRNLLIMILIIFL